jgi:hypothetical protein
MKRQALPVSPNTNLSTPSVELEAPGRTDLANSVSRLRTMLVVALLVSGSAGLAVNFVLGQQNPQEAAVPEPTLLASAGELTTATHPEREVAVAAPKPAALRFRKVDAFAPDDPFQPTLPTVAAPPKAALAKGTPKHGAAAPGAAIEAAAQAAADAAAPAPEMISLVGIIQGDPALAVVKLDGQSFFLKIGEQVADTWRLEQIGERSATFSLGKRRVEVPLREGSSS